MDPHNEEKTVLPKGGPLISADQGPHKEHQIITNVRTDGKFMNEGIFPKGKGNPGRKEQQNAGLLG